MVNFWSNPVRTVLLVNGTADRLPAGTTNELIFCCGNTRTGNFVLTWRRNKLLELQPPRRHNKAKSTLASQPILANSKPVRLEDCQVLEGLRSHEVMLRCSCGQCRRRGLAEYNSFLQGMLHGSIGSSEAYRSSRQSSRDLLSVYLVILVSKLHAGHVFDIHCIIGAQSLT